MLKILPITIFIFLLALSTGNAADREKIKKYIANNIYYDCCNPIFKEEDKIILNSFTTTLMNSTGANDKNTISSSLQDLYDSFAMGFSDSNEERRGHCITAVYFAKLALLSSTGGSSSESNRPLRLLDHAKHSLLASGELNSELLAQQYIALLILEYYLTNDFNYDEMSKHLGGLCQDKQDEFKATFKNEIAKSQK